MRGIGANRTRRAHNHKEDRHRSEVTYYTTKESGGCPTGYATSVLEGTTLSRYCEPRPICVFPYCVPYPYGGINMDVRTSTSGLVSTTHDLLRIAVELCVKKGGGLLSGSVGEMFSDQTRGTRRGGYGFGLFLDGLMNRPDVRFGVPKAQGVWHTGRFAGSLSLLWMARNDSQSIRKNASVALLIGTDTGYGDREIDFNGMVEKVLGTMDLASWGDGDLWDSILNPPR